MRWGQPWIRTNWESQIVFVSVTQTRHLITFWEDSNSCEDTILIAKAMHNWTSTTRQASMGTPISLSRTESVERSVEAECRTGLIRRRFQGTSTQNLAFTIGSINTPLLHPNRLFAARI